MFKFTYVEDYIEFIAGWRDANGKLLSLFSNVPSPLSLARYDVQIVSSLGEQTALNHKGYTDKQSLLAVKIVDKYRRQLSKLAVPIIVPEAIDQFRHPIRIVDRSKSAYSENDLFAVKFPYDTKLIDAVKAQAKSGNGRIAFDHDKKIWYLAKTESNLNWIMTMKELHQIEVSEELQGLYTQLLEVETRDNKIYLNKITTGYEIVNSDSNLVDYIEQNLGGLGDENVLRLVDAAATLGYDVSPDVKNQACGLLGDNQALCSIVNNRISVVKKEAISLEAIIEYARLVDRLPLHIYTTGTPEVDTDDIKYLNRGKNYNVFPKLMVSYTATLIGSKKESWQTNAEKIIYLEQ